MDCDLPEEDFLQQLSSDLEIPMLLEESLQSDREMDSLFEASSFFKEFEEDWGLDPFHKAPDTLPQVSYIKEEIKSEPYTIPSSPSSLSHDSWSSSDSKHILETPPISPPLSSGSESPPRTPSPPTSREPPVIMVGGKPIRIVSFKNGKLPDNKTKIIIPRPISQSVIIQQKPLNMGPITLNKNNGQKTLVLSPSKFNALTNQMAANKASAQTNIRIVHPLQSTATVKTEPSNDKQEIQLKAIKRQQRMIKNRESACLSRKKKKEYIYSLESRINDLEKENIQLKMENDVLKARLGHSEPMASKIPKTVFNVNIKKTAILGVLLLISVNLGSLSLMSRGRSGADALLSVPSLPLAKHSGRHLLWDDSDQQNITANSPSYSSASSEFSQPTCPLHINQTESLRLNSELRRWIGADKPVYNNNSERNLDSSRSESDMVDLRLSKESQLMLRQPPPPTPIIPRQRRKLKIARREDQELQLSVPNSGLLEALHRRDDTFYVVSFSGDHLLLPALAHNNSVRPKMSLVLPALPLNSTMDTAAPVMMMMQIDCEVLDTRLLELNERDIPSHLRQAPSKPSPTKSSPHKNVSDDDEPVRNTYRPYFLRSNSFVDPYSPLAQDRQRFT